MTTDRKNYAEFSMPASDGVAVTPSDVTNLATPFRALYVGSTGTVTLVTLTGTVLSFVALPAGVILPVRGVRVNSTGTTASSIVALW